LDPKPNLSGQEGKSRRFIDSLKPDKSRMNPCLTQFFLAHDQGKSPPRLHKARVEGIWIKASHDIETHSSPFKLGQPNLKRLADEASEGTHPIAPITILSIKEKWG